MTQPLLNITMPVFNRFHLTQKAILSLRKTRSAIPYALTVVDNGSAPELRRRLLEFLQDGIIDRLFLLPRNMGISCACNLGWQTLDAPFYMKLDNDMRVLTPHWLDRLFSLWSHGDPMSILGPSYSLDQLRAEPGRLVTHDGELGICPINLAGQCILIPRTVSDVLGMWNEDYGLYGAEDGDYGLRMVCAGLRQYYYYAPPLVEHMGTDPRDYAHTGLDKRREHSNLFHDAGGGVGLYKINYYLYNMCIRSWKVPLRYRLEDVNARHEATLAENPAYAPVGRALQRSKRLIDSRVARCGEAGLADERFILHLKRLWRDCGQECDALMARGA